MKSQRQILAESRAERRRFRESGLCECGEPNPNSSRWGCDDCHRRYLDRNEADEPMTLALKYIRQQEGLCAVEIAANANITIEECSSALASLKRRGDIESVWEKGFGMVYRLTTEQKRRVA